MPTALIDHDYTVPLADWVATLPTDGSRPRMTAAGYHALLRHMLDGEQVPFYTDPRELVSDLGVAQLNERMDLARKLEYAEAQTLHAVPALQRVWALIFASGTKKTLRLDDVRDAIRDDS